MSVQLSNEAEQNWFGYNNDGRLLTVPSKEYIRRYIEHCKEIGIRYNILFVKNPCKKIITGEFPKRTEKLGYDLTAASLDVSLVGMDEGMERQKNKYGYIEDIKAFETYIRSRNKSVQKYRGERLGNTYSVSIYLVKEL